MKTLQDEVVKMASKIDNIQTESAVPSMQRRKKKVNTLIQDTKLSSIGPKAELAFTQSEAEAALVEEDAESTAK